MENITQGQNKITHEMLATLRHENAQLKQEIIEKENIIKNLKEELQDDSSRIDYLFDIIAIQEQERSILEASIKGEESICNCGAIHATNDNIFTTFSTPQMA